MVVEDSLLASLGFLGERSESNVPLPCLLLVAVVLA